MRSLVQRLGHQPWFASVMRRFVPLDRRIHRWTRGRFAPMGGGWLIPTLLLTTTGRRSGQPRSQPLLYVEDAGDFIVIGSNWGQGHQPAWSGNLIAEPEAAVTVGGRTTPVRARLVTGDERAQLFGKLATVWPAYHTYVERAGGRDIRLFRLTPRT